MNRKRLVFYLILAVGTAALVETASFLVFRFVLEGRDFLHVDLDRIKSVITESQIMEQKEAYDPVLGWIYPAGLSKTTQINSTYTWSYKMDDCGARYNPYDGPGGLISIYGDSYAFGADVNDDETWGYHLSVLAGTKVDNWGTPAYGTDQAVLRVRENYQDHPTDVVILTVLSENINRIMTAYWPFYTLNLGLKIGFKPVLVETSGGFRWEPNPLRRLESIEDFRAAFDRAKEIDYWYQLNETKPRSKFPYTVAALDAAQYHLVKPPNDLYESVRATDRLDRILTDFVDLGEELGFQPVILFIPNLGGANEALEQYVLNVRSALGFGRASVVDLFDLDFHRETVGNQHTGQHLSASGNQELARVVYEDLKRLELVD